jgi:hypothetical protein
METVYFLKKHNKYPELKCLSDMKPQEVKPLFECNGFCATNILNPINETENEINFDTRDIDEKPFEQQHGSY